jgi:predicted nucleic-acid-binding protein
MIALDTNILVRVLTRDNLDQFRIAMQFLSRNECWVQTSVIHELEWVLRSFYRYSPSQIADALDVLFATKGLLIAEPERLGKAAEGLRNGLDFSDAYHLAGAIDCRSFITFDHTLIKRAPRVFHQPSVTHP